MQKIDKFIIVILELKFHLQDLIDKARTTLVGNRSLLQRMQASTGISVATVDEDPAFANFNQVCFSIELLFLLL